MMLKIKVLTVICMLLFFAACGPADNAANPGNPGDNTTDPIDPGDNNTDPGGSFINPENAVTVSFNAAGVLVDNPFVNVSVANTGAHVLITSTAPDTINYVLSGVNNNASVEIRSGAPFGLWLNGLDISAADRPAINLTEQVDAAVHLVSKTTNRLTDGAASTVKAALFSKGNLTFEDNGTLEIRGKYSHAVVSDSGSLNVKDGTIRVLESVKDGFNIKQNFTMSGGSLYIRSGEDGIQADADAVISGGSININATTGDGLKSDGDIDILNAVIDITVSGDAAKAINNDNNLTLTNVTMNLITTGGAFFEEEENDTSSAAGLKCDGDLVINSGNISINSSGVGGKGINITGSITFNGGTTTVTTSGDQYIYTAPSGTVYDTAAKAVKSDGDLIVNGGNIKINTSKIEAEGLESKTSVIINDGIVEIDAHNDAINATDSVEINGGRVFAYSQQNDAIDSNGSLYIRGGIVIAMGAGGPESGFDCDHGKNTFEITGENTIAISAGGTTSQPSAGSNPSVMVTWITTMQPNTPVRLETALGEDVLTFVIPRRYTQMSMLLSAPGLAAGLPYNLRAGGTITDGTDVFHGYRTGTAYFGGTVIDFTTNSSGSSFTPVDNR